MSSFADSSHFRTPEFWFMVLRLTRTAVLCFYLTLHTTVGKTAPSRKLQKCKAYHKGFSQGSFFSFIACFPMSDNNCLVYFFQFYDCLPPEGYSNTCYSNITPKQKDLNQKQKKKKMKTFSGSLAYSTSNFPTL